MENQYTSRHFLLFIFAVICCGSFSSCSSIGKVKKPRVYVSPRVTTPVKSLKPSDKPEEKQVEKPAPKVVPGINNQISNTGPRFSYNNSVPRPNADKPLQPKIYVDEKMKHQMVPIWEADFKYGNHVASGRKFKLNPFVLDVPGEVGEQLHVTDCKPANGYSGYYEKQKVTKKRIVLHFTVGNIRSDINQLTQQKPGKSKWRNSVPFVIARDGTIYQLFGSNYWSHHLGNGTIGGNQASSAASIGIELSNYGPLIRVGDNLETIYSRRNGSNDPDVYCTLSDTDQYVKLETPFKGYQYFTKFTEEQCSSLIVLLRFLTAKYNIPRKFLPEHKRYLTNYETAMFRGIVSHLNYRSTGKWDIGPAFQWDTIIRGVLAPSYKPNGVFVDYH